MKVGDLVRETETDPAWILYRGTLGLILRSADEDMGLCEVEGTHHWWVSWGTGETHMMCIDDIEVVQSAVG